MTDQGPPPARLPFGPDGPLGRAVSPVPFFSRLGVKQGVIFSALILLGMTVITAVQLNETLGEIRRNAVRKGQTVTGAVAPLVLPALKQAPDLLKRYFNVIGVADDIDYVQVVDARGQVELSSDLLPGRHPPQALAPDWLHELKSATYDLRPASVLWPDGPGVDIFVALMEEQQPATPAEAAHARHLRIGINFNNLIKRDTPRLIYEMVLFTLIVTGLVLLGLLPLLRYVLKPLRELHQGLRAVAAGDLEYQVPVYSRDEIGRVVTAFNAMTERLRDAFRQIEALATHDALTGLANRRAFDERLSYEAARSRRYGRAFGLLIFDLDNFKEVNDRFGHPAGDQTLKYVAGLLKRHVRETDLAARIGGEEFGVILPETQPPEVRAVAEKLRAVIGAGVLPPEAGAGPGVSITASAGAACSSAERATPAALMAAADGALYASKSRGRNCVTLAES